MNKPYWFVTLLFCPSLTDRGEVRNLHASNWRRVTLISMAEDMLSPRSDYGRTFITAMWVLGAIAGLQVAAVSWAVLTKKPRQPIASQRLTPPAVEPETPAIAVAQNPVNQQTSVIPPINLGTPDLKPPTQPASVLPGPAFQMPDIPPAPRQSDPNAPQPLGTALASTALESHPAHKIEDRLVSAMVVAGEELRGTGNMQSALKSLRDAEEALPNHPRILAELAGTFSQMGLEEKALDYWKQIYKLGESNAGGYYALAEMALKGNMMTSAAGTTAAVLSIKNVEVKKSPIDPKTGEKVTLRVTVDGDSKVRPSGEEMEMSVYFFDKVDGKLIDSTTADTKQDYPTAPYDWQGGSSESVDVVYNQPVFTVEQKRELGKRVYYGYVIELYYREQLQDTVAEPQELLEMHAEPASNDRPLGPDGSLFPAGINE